MSEPCTVRPLPDVVPDYAQVAFIQHVERKPEKLAKETRGD